MTKIEDSGVMLGRLDEELTPELVERLVAYCGHQCSRRPWYGLLDSGCSSIAEGHEPEDIVHRAIEKTIAGVVHGAGKHRRIWDGQRDLFDFLTSVIDSEVSNLGNGWVNRHFRRGSQMRRQSESEDSTESFFEEIADKSLGTPEEVMVKAEVEAAADDFVGAFLDSLEDDFLVDVVGQIIDGAHKPKEIAEVLGVGVAEVYNARKRLGRRLTEFRDRSRRGGSQ